MTGRVDSSGRALLPIAIRPSDVAEFHDIEAWIDAGFNGDLVLPQRRIDELLLPQSGTVRAILADGLEYVMNAYSCQIIWFGAKRSLEVVGNDGEYPLLGVGLLRGHDLLPMASTGEEYGHKRNRTA
jgi:clan AA aspartic protease